MGQSTLEVQEDGLHVSTDQLERLGWQPGQQVELSHSPDCLIVRRKGSADRSIIRAAMNHLESEVGFNTGIDYPKWEGGRFEVSAFRSFDQRYLGKLVFTEDGDLIADASTPDAVMRELADAP